MNINFLKPISPKCEIIEVIYVLIIIDYFSRFIVTNIWCVWKDSAVLAGSDALSAEWYEKHILFVVNGSNTCSNPGRNG